MRVSLRVARRAKAGLASVVLPGIAAILLGLLLPSSGLSQEQGNPNPQVIPPHAVPFGKSYGEWGAAWWNWAFSSPVEINSVVDETGEFCDVNQSGPVWFLAGISGFVPPADVPVERECTVPAGKALFFPILNSFCVGEGDGSEEAQRACARAFVDIATVLEASVDGRPLTGLSKYRAESSAFVLHLPIGAIIDQLLGISGDLEPAVADGFWIMLAPLPVGEHVIHFRGATPAFETEVIYHLTVAPRRP